MQGDKLAIESIDRISPLSLPNLLPVSFQLQFVSLDFEFGELLPHLIQLGFNLDLVLVIFPSCFHLSGLEHVFLDLKFLQARRCIVQFLCALSQLCLGLTDLCLHLYFLELCLAYLIFLREEVTLDLLQLKFPRLKLFGKFFHLLGGRSF